MSADKSPQAGSDIAAAQDLEYAEVENSAVPDGLQRLSKVIWRVCTFLGCLSLVLLLLTVVANVVLRAVLGQGLLGANELVSSWWMVSVVFLGIALAQHSESRIQVDFLMDAVTGMRRRVVDVAALVITLLVGLALAVAGGLEAVHQASVGEYTPIGDRLIWPFRFVVPVSFLAFSFACLLSLIQLLGQPLPKEHQR